MTALVTRNSATAEGVTKTGASVTAATVMQPVQIERAGDHRTRPSTAQVPGSAITLGVDEQGMGVPPLDI